MIDPKTGNIRISKSLELNSNSNFDSIRTQNLGDKTEVRDMGNGYKWLDIKNVLIENEFYIISICFKSEKLIKISFVFDEKPINISKDWNSWSEKEEKENLKKLNNWT